MDWLAGLGRFAIFAAAVAARLLSPSWRGEDLLAQFYTITTRCVGPVVAVTLPFGMVIALQGLTIFDLFGAQRLLASLVSVAVLRELAPVLASVLVAAQGGSAFAAELGSMRIKEELDATEVMAVDGVAYHVVPRVLAATFACPLLHLAGSAAGVGGAYITAVLLKGETSGIFMAQLWAFTGPMDLWGSLLKTTVFGVIIGLVSCYMGYHARGGAAGVGRAVNETVVYSVLTFITVNYFLTSALFGQLT
jgi:phospholipid/cholesterol/gamma-HCH transport system permease protein